MRIARVTAVGAAVEADRALRARDLPEAETEADALARARIHLDRLEAAAEGGGPVERAWLAVGIAEAARARGEHEPALWQAAAEQWDKLERPYCAATAALAPGGGSGRRRGSPRGGRGGAQRARGRRATGSGAGCAASCRACAHERGSSLPLPGAGASAGGANGDTPGIDAEAPADSEEIPFGLTPRASCRC